MLDTFSRKEDYFHLVVDQETFGILATSNSLPVAHAVSLGMANTSVMSVQLFGCEHLRGNRYNLELDKHLVLVRKGPAQLIPSESNVAKRVEETRSKYLFDVEPLETAGADWIQKRQLSVARQRMLSLVEQKIERFLARSKTFFGDEIFIPFMAKELDDPASLAIQEWAEIQGISVSEARDDLSIKIKSTQLFVCKMNAIWEKYIKILNQLIDENEMFKIVTVNLEMELRSGVR